MPGEQGGESVVTGSSDADDLATLLAHDMKNHLQVADKRLEEHVGASGESDALRHVRRSIDRMKDMTEDVLVLSKQREENIEIEDVELDEIARSAWEDVEAEGSDLILGGSRSLEADPTALQRVLENLLGNSLSHGGESVTVEVGATSDGFYVEDDGDGIPSHVRERVFDRGFSMGGGSGLGLHIVDRIAELHGWDVEARESEDGGARFEFSV